MVRQRGTLSSLFRFEFLVFHITLLLVGCSVVSFRHPLPHPPSLAILQAQILSVEEFHEIIEGILVARCSAIVLVGDGSFVEVGNGEGGSLEGLQQLLWWRLPARIGSR